MKTTPTKEKLLSHYAETEPDQYLQIDWFICDPNMPDPIINPHGEPTAGFYHEAWELWRGHYAMRVSIGADTNLDAALHFLQETIQLLEKIQQHPKQILEDFNPLSYNATD